MIPFAASDWRAPSVVPVKVNRWAIFYLLRPFGERMKRANKVSENGLTMTPPEIPDDNINSIYILASRLNNTDPQSKEFLRISQVYSEEKLKSILIPSKEWQPFPTAKDRDAWPNLSRQIRQVHKSKRFLHLWNALMARRQHYQTASRRIHNYHCP